MGITRANTKQSTPLPTPTHPRRTRRGQADRKGVTRPARRTAERTDPGRAPRTGDRARWDRPGAEKPPSTTRKTMTDITNNDNDEQQADCQDRRPGSSRKARSRSSSWLLILEGQRVFITTDGASGRRGADRAAGDHDRDRHIGT